MGDAETTRNAGTEVVHQHVGVAHESHEHCETLGPLEVEHKGALAAIDADEGQAFGLQRGRMVAQVVAVGRFDLTTWSPWSASNVQP